MNFVYNHVLKCFILYLSSIYFPTYRLEALLDTL